MNFLNNYFLFSDFAFCFINADIFSNFISSLHRYKNFEKYIVDINKHIKSAIKNAKNHHGLNETIFILFLFGSTIKAISKTNEITKEIENEIIKILNALLLSILSFIASSCLNSHVSYFEVKNERIIMTILQIKTTNEIDNKIQSINFKYSPRKTSGVMFLCQKQMLHMQTTKTIIDDRKPIIPYQRFLQKLLFASISKLYLCEGGM